MEPRPNQKRLPRYRRVGGEELPFKLVEEDRQLLKWVWECRFLTSRHFQRLDTRSNQFVLKRLQKLFHHAYLDRIPTAGHNEPFLYGLANRGADELAWAYGIARGKIDWEKKNRDLKDRYFQAHTLMVAHFRVVLHLALKDHLDAVLSPETPGATFCYKHAEGTRHTIEPDWFFTLIDRDEDLDFLLEADRSTMTDRDFLSKLTHYWAFWRQEQVKASQGLEARNAFRVLTICKSGPRAENLRAIAREADDRKTGSELFWFTAEQRYGLEHPGALFEPIWRTAKNDAWRHLLE